MLRSPRVALSLALCVLACSGSAPADGPLEAFHTYRKAMRDGDLEALKACLVEERAKDLDGPQALMILPLLKEMAPKSERVEGVEESGDTATIRLSQIDEGSPARGEVHLKRIDGAWRVEKESWHFGDLTGAGAGREESAKPRPEPEGDWRFDLEGREIPDRPAAGRFGGRPFVARSVELSDAMLTISDGEGMDETGRFIVFLFLPEGEGLSGRTIEIPYEQDFGAEVTAHVHFWDDKAPSGKQSDARTSEFALRIVFAEEADGKLPGRIWLSYPDEAKSYVVGSFTATVGE